MKTFCVLTISCLILLPVAYAADNDDRGFLENPPVFVVSEPDMPLTGLGVEVPPQGVTIPDFDLVGVSSDGWREDGHNVQPALSVKSTVGRIGALHGFANGWAVGASLPWSSIRAHGAIGGQPSNGLAQGFGDLSIIGKKILWTGRECETLVAAAGVQVPTGKDDAQFYQSNPVTNAYYGDDTRRMPLSWQPGNGAVNGYLAVSYGRECRRLSYMGLVATKLYGSGDQDVHIGNILICAGTASYGISRTLAVSLGLTLRTQADDSYPNAPPPGINQPALAGTTQHGTTLYLDPSIRYRISKLATVGVGFTIPIVKPENGMVPQTQVALIFYPNL